MTPRRRSPDARQELGRAGESAAERVLLRAGMAIVERRFRCRFGEVDLVAFHADAVVFIEVKARRATGYGLPAEAVTPTKQRRLARVALFWLARHRATERPVRFDVVEVVGDPDQGGFRTRHIRDAFRPSPTVLSGRHPVRARH